MTEPSLPHESLFLEAVELPAGADRAAYLDRACGANQQLRAEVESLLCAHEQSGDLLDLPDKPAGSGQAVGRNEASSTAAGPVPAASELPGTMIGRYKLLEQIGEGGFGVVYMAEQAAPIRRRVALKLIKPGMDTRQVIARFEAERQALAI